MHNNIKFRIRLLIVFLALGNVLYGQSESKRFSQKDLLEDFDFMIKTMIEVHPNIYAYLSKEEFNKTYESVKKSIDCSMSKLEFFLNIAPMVAKIGDGHTSVYTSMDNYRSGLVFPFLVKIIDNEIIIVKNLSEDSTFITGTKIIRINDLNSLHIIDSVLHYQNGERQAFRNTQIAHNFGEFLFSIYNIHNDYKLEYRLPNDIENQAKIIKGIESKDYWKRKYNDFKRYSFHINPKQDFAYMDVRAFEDKNEYFPFLNNAFQEINKSRVSNLIIDIRKHGGGSSTYGNSLISYITTEPFSQFGRVDVKVSNQIKEKLIIDGEDTTSFNVKNVLNCQTGSIVEWEEKLIKPRKQYHFNGNVYLLISPYTFSAAGNFAVTLKDYKIATLIGEETGALGTTYGDAYQFFLPNTKLKCSVSFCYFLRPAGFDDKKGVLPDYEVITTADDIINNIDPVMDFTLNLINKKTE